MVNVKLKFNDDCLSEINVTGHSDYSSENGNDLVCAGVSSIMFGALNALSNNDLNREYITVDDNLINVKNDCENDIINNILETVYYQLITIKDSYSEYITIKE